MIEMWWRILSLVNTWETKMIFQLVIRAAQQLISINVLHMINGYYQLYNTGFTPSNTYALPYQSHTYKAKRPCNPWLYPHWPCNDEIMKMKIKHIFPIADTRNECRQERRICIWKLSIINVVITITATATTTIFLLVVDYTVKFSSHRDHYPLYKLLLVTFTPPDADQFTRGCLFVIIIVLLHCFF